MIRSVFDRGIAQMETVTNRTYKPEQKEFMYRTLGKIGDVTFQKIVESYIREIKPPTNVIGYFLNNIPAKPDETYKDDGVSGWKNSQYTPEDQVLFLRCVTIAVELAKQKKMMYKDWVEPFNRNWVNRSGANLASWLRSCYKGMCEYIGTPQTPIKLEIQKTIQQSKKEA